MTIPKHQNPSDNRTAHAPYNFVPLPHKVVTVLSQEEIEQAEQDGTLDVLLDERLPPHNRYIEGRHSGYFEVTLTTETPLYIRAPLTLDEFSQRQSEDQPSNFREQAKNKPDFFYTNSQTRLPVIPGSSLRGMLRNLVEIVGYGKMQWVTQKRLFFRTVDNSAIGTHYRNRMGNDKIEAGFLRRTDTGYAIVVCRHLRVHREQLGGANGANLYTPQNRTKIPKWGVNPNQPSQYKSVWVFPNGKFVETIYYDDSQEGTIPGILVITGDVPGKKKEFVFLLDSTEDIEVPQEMLDRFNDDDQITQYQQKAFPTDKPSPNARKRNGMLQESPSDPGEPVFFLRENGTLTFLGRAGMFRLPYHQSPYDLIPTELRRPLDIDWAEAMFGYVKGDEVSFPQGHRLRAYASRISVTDATLAPQNQQDLSEGTVTPGILSTPKPTSFQHYLVQDTDQKDQLKHYGSDGTTIRGHKLYWHHGRISASDLNQEGVSENSTQHTQFRPVKPGISFTFRIYFENLSKEELGLLAWVLMLPGRDGVQYRHKLGMAKPFGMGAVKLDPQLYLVVRSERYRTLFHDTGWELGESDESERLESLCLDFEQTLMQEIGEQHQRLCPVGRIKELLALLEWHEDSSPKSHMGLEQFKQRRVLPTPTRESFIQPNDKVEGKVIDIQGGNVIFEITDAPDERMIGIIPVDKLEGRQYRVDAAVSAIIEQIEEHLEDDEILIYCRPKPKKKKG